MRTETREAGIEWWGSDPAVWRWYFGAETGPWCMIRSDAKRGLDDKLQALSAEGKLTNWTYGPVRLAKSGPVDPPKTHAKSKSKNGSGPTKPRARGKRK